MIFVFKWICQTARCPIRIVDMIYCVAFLLYVEILDRVFGCCSLTKTATWVSSGALAKPIKSPTIKYWIINYLCKFRWRQKVFLSVFALSDDDSKMSNFSFWYCATQYWNKEMVWLFMERGMKIEFSFPLSSVHKIADN